MRRRSWKGIPPASEFISDTGEWHYFALGYLLGAITILLMAAAAFFYLVIPDHREVAK
jgi:hypothetical protein